MLKTPDYSHLSDSDFEDVYEPAEDSFLFLDALENDLDLIRNQVQPDICLEVGSGSGVITGFLSMHLRRPCQFLCTDLNPMASLAASSTCERNSSTCSYTVECISCDLASPFLTRLNQAIDVILFNPPYVVTPSEEIAATPISTAWAGGLKGREVTDRFIPMACQLLSPRGFVYLLLCSENDPNDVINQFRQQGGLHHQIVASRRAGSERLQVIRFHHPDVSPNASNQNTE